MRYRSLPSFRGEYCTCATRPYDYSRWPTYFDRRKAKRMKQLASLSESKSKTETQVTVIDSETQEELSEATATSTPPSSMKQDPIKLEDVLPPRASCKNKKKNHFKKKINKNKKLVVIKRKAN